METPTTSDQMPEWALRRVIGPVVVILAVVICASAVLGEVLPLSHRAKVLVMFAPGMVAAVVGFVVGAVLIIKANPQRRS